MEYESLVLVCVGVAVKHTMYQHKVGVDMLNAVKSVLANVSSASPSISQHTLYGLQHIHTNLTYYIVCFSCNDLFLSSYKIQCSLHHLSS